jgi:hypothetical protein
MDEFEKWREERRQPDSISPAKRPLESHRDNPQGLASPFNSPTVLPFAGSREVNFDSSDMHPNPPAKRSRLSREDTPTPSPKKEMDVDFFITETKTRNSATTHPHKPTAAATNITGDEFRNQATGLVDRTYKRISELEDKLANLEFLYKAIHIENEQLRKRNGELEQNVKTLREDNEG